MVWWGAAGCGGLTAAAVGQAAAVSPLGFGVAELRGFGWAALGFWAVASALLIPIVVGSTSFLLRHPLGRVPWPPAFSTGVYALGAVQAGKLLGFPAVTDAAVAAAAGALSLWTLAVLSRIDVLGRTGTLGRACASQGGGRRRWRSAQTGQRPSSSRGRDSTAE